MSLPVGGSARVGPHPFIEITGLHNHPDSKIRKVAYFALLGLTALALPILLLPMLMVQGRASFLKLSRRDTLIEVFSGRAFKKIWGEGMTELSKPKP